MVKKVKKKKVSKPSQEFEEKKKFIKLQDELSLKQHERKMEELKYARETDRLHHEREMERQRIRSAEIQRTIARKEQAHARKWNNQDSSSFYQQ